MVVSGNASFVVFCEAWRMEHRMNVCTMFSVFLQLKIGRAIFIKQITSIVILKRDAFNQRGNALSGIAEIIH
jgi:hypothetical protein